MPKICTLCARSGSKGVKNKNIRNLVDKPLIAHSILQAKASRLFDAIAVSSDSEIILEIANKYQVDYCIQRPDFMATDEAGKLPAIRHCFQEAEKLAGHSFEIIVDLDVTSPLRNISDIQLSVELLETNNAPNLITATSSRRSPYFNIVEMNELGQVVLSKPLMKPILSRQDSPKCFDMNASIYIWQRDALINENSIFLQNTGLYVMPEERSIDIDSELDFDFVEFLMKKRIPFEY